MANLPSIYRGTTPAFVFHMPEGLDLDEYFFTIAFAQEGEVVIEKTSNDDEAVLISGHDIVCYLTQEETLGLNVGSAEVQIRYADDEDPETESEAWATNIVKFKVLRILDEDVI